MLVTDTINMYSRNQDYKHCRMALSPPDGQMYRRNKLSFCLLPITKGSFHLLYKRFAADSSALCPLVVFITI
jgi:hypothetical protein